MAQKRTSSKGSRGREKPETPKGEPRETTAESRSLADSPLPTMPGGTNVWAPSYDDIARKAYSLWESRGKPIGSPDEDWHRAVQELYGVGNSTPQK